MRALEIDDVARTCLMNCVRTRDAQLVAMGANVLKTFARKFSNIDFFLNILPLRDDELVMSEKFKKWGFTDFVLERTCPEEHLNVSRWGFVSEKGHSGCKS